MSLEIVPQQSSVLSCWKDIANYLGKGVRTVQRWEQEFGLPVLRPNGENSNRAVVVAYPKDLDLWVATKWATRERTKDWQRAQPQKTEEEIRSELNSSVEASRMLRHSNRELLQEVRQAVRALVDNCNILRTSLKVEASPAAIRVFLADREACPVNGSNVATVDPQC